MTDPELKRLVEALDTATEWAAKGEVQSWSDDLEIADLRLRCLRKRLGDAVGASPYLDFLQRLGLRRQAQQPAVAAGA